MLVEKTKAAVKSRPVAYKSLRPIVNLIRRIKYYPLGASMQAFRKYCALLPEIVPEPIFVKVGANDGVTGDPCSDILLANNKWKGLLIEPVPYCFERLKVNFHDPRRFSLEQVAIGSTVGRKTFYYVDRAAYDVIPNLPSWFDQLGSFDKIHILKALNGILAPFIVECSIEVTTLSELLNKHGIRNLHLLHIDTEGYDYEVLTTLDFATHIPVMIFVEHVNLPKGQKKELLQLLHKHGYQVRNCGEDYFAFNKESYKTET